MGIFRTAFLGGFFGKLAATLLVAISFALGFGPDKWAAFMIQDLPIWITPTVARMAFITLGAVAFLLFFWPQRKSKKQKKSAAEIVYPKKTWIQKIFDNEDRPEATILPTIGFTWRQDGLPASVENGAYICVLHLIPQQEPKLNYVEFQGGGSLPWHGYKNDITNVCRCQIINYGDSPLFRPVMHIKVSFYDVNLSASADGGTNYKKGKLNSTYEWDLQFYDLILSPKNGEFKFWIYNSSKFLAQVDFPDHLTAVIGKGKGSKKISLVHNNERKWIGLLPTKKD